MGTGNPQTVKNIWKNAYRNDRKETGGKMTFYICPNCKRHSKTMKFLRDSRYDPKDEGFNPGKFRGIYCEILRCKCGRLLTWFDMIEKTTLPLLKEEE